MRRRIDSQCQAADDTKPVMSKLTGKRFCVMTALASRASAANNRQRGSFQTVEFATEIKLMDSRVQLRVMRRPEGFGHNLSLHTRLQEKNPLG